MTSIQRALEFNPLGRNGKNHKRSLVTGLTMTVYDTRFGLSKEAQEVLGHPEKVSITFYEEMDAFFIRADENGLKGTGRHNYSAKQYQCSEVRDILIKRKNCDFKNNIYRLMNGKFYKTVLVFSIEDLLEVGRDLKE